MGLGGAKVIMKCIDIAKGNSCKEKKRPSIMEDQYHTMKRRKPKEKTKWSLSFAKMGFTRTDAIQARYPF